MLDIKVIRENPEDVKMRLKGKQVDCDKAIDRILELDGQRRELIFKTESAKSEQNKVSKEIPKLKKEGQDTTEVEERLAEVVQEMGLYSCVVDSDRGWAYTPLHHAKLLSNVERVWEQVPKLGGQGHFSHRLAFDGSQKLWITSGDRQAFDPAQSMTGNLGKILRLKGKGIPFLRGQGRGDQHVKIKVLTPQKLSSRQKELLQEFAEESGANVNPEQNSWKDNLKKFFK